MVIAPLFQWYPLRCQTTGCPQRHWTHEDGSRFHTGTYVRIRHIARASISVELIRVGPGLIDSSFRYTTGYFPGIRYAIEVVRERGNAALAERIKEIVLPMILADAAALEEMSKGL